MFERNDVHAIMISLVVAERHQWQRAQITVDTNPPTRSTTMAFYGGNTDKSRSKKQITKGIYIYVCIWGFYIYLFF